MTFAMLLASNRTQVSIAGVIGLLLLLATGSEALAAPVGKVVAARGAVTVQPTTGVARIVGRDDPINQGDVLNTGNKGLAVLEFNDGTRMALRPRSVFKVEEWRTEPKQESAVTRLF